MEPSVAAAGTSGRPPLMLARRVERDAVGSRPGDDFSSRKVAEGGGRPSGLAKNRILNPASANVLPALPAMPQPHPVVTPRLLQRIAQHRHAVEGAILVDALGQLH